MANYRYTYDYGGRRYEIDAPKGATAADLQAIIEGSAGPTVPPRAAAPKPKPKKKEEEESFLSGVIPTLKSATGRLRSDLGLALEKAAPYLGNAIPVPAPILEFLGARERRAGERLTAKAEAELPAASVAERQRQARSIQTAKPGTGSQILAGIGRATALSTDLLRPALSGVTREFLPQTPEEAARALAKVQAPFQTGRGAAEFIASQAPATLIPLGGGKAVQVARGLTLPRVGREAAKAALARDVGTGVVFSGGAMNAASAGGQAYRDVLAKGGTQEEADRAFKIAALGAGAVSGVASRMPGLEQLAFASPPARGGIIRSAGRAAIGEAPQEFVEEAGAQLATNVAKLGTAAEAPVGEDVLSSGLLGAIGGATIAAPIGGLQGAFNRGETEASAPPPPTAPRAPRTPPPPADMGALAKALGPVGGKVTLQEPTGPQEYVFQGFDEDGGVVLADADGVIFSEDPDQVQAAIKAGIVEPESGLGGMAFGMDITEGLPDAATPPPPPPPPPVAPRAPSYVADNAQSTVEMLRQKNPAVLKTVADLHAEDMTAAEIAAATGLGADTVRDVRLGLGLPDQGKGTAGIAGAGAPADPQERAAFETWRDNYKAENAPPPPPTTASIDSAVPRAVYAARNGINPLAHEDLIDQLEFLQTIAESGRLTPERLAQSDFGKNQDTATIMVLNEAISSDPVGTILKLRERADATAPPPATDIEPAPKAKFTFDPTLTATPAAPKPIYTPQQIVENLESFAASEAQDRELDVPMFRAGVRDVQRGFEPIAERQILLMQGPEALAAYKAGMQWARERIAEAEPEPAPAAEAEPEPLPPPPAAPRAVGKSDRATIPATREKVDVQYELQDLDNIRFAEGELQNRDRSRPQTQQFLRRFTSQFDPEGLGEDKSTDRGAPIINKDNVILSGNGRTLGLEEIYDKYPEQAEAYREFLREEGYDIEGIERPILVRRLMSDIDERKFVVGSNEADIAALSPPEQAAQDAKDILTPKVLSKFNGGDLKATKNDAFVSAFLAELSPQQRENAMDDKGKVSAQALKRIENALLYKAYGGTGRASDIFISKAMERTDDDTKTLTNSLVDVSKDWIKFQQAIEDGEVDKKYNITNKLMETVGTVSDIKASGNSVGFELRSPDMVEPMDPFVRDILLAFYDDKISRMLSRKAIAEKLRAYTEVASNQQPEPDMFGMAETPSARAIWKRVDGGEGVGQADMFASIQPIPPKRRDEILDEGGRVPSLSRGVNRLKKLWAEGKITDAEFALEVASYSDFIENMKSAKRWKDLGKRKVRGPDRIREVLLQQKRLGNLSEEEVNFAEWFILRNENLLDDLGISVIKAPKDSNFLGDYEPFSRVMRLIKGRAKDGTAVHEIMHHLERMMPQDIRMAIKRSWAKELDSVEKLPYEGKNENDAMFFQAIRAFHDQKGIDLKGKYYSPTAAFNFATGLIASGKVDGRLYQYVNPSEFWAVNATGILQGRYDVQGSLLGRLKNWLRELATKIKGLFGLDSNAPIIKALDSLAKSDGKFVSNQMLEDKALGFGNIRSSKRINAIAAVAALTTPPASAAVSDTPIAPNSALYKSLESGDTKQAIALIQKNSKDKDARKIAAILAKNGVGEQKTVILDPAKDYNKAVTTLSENGANPETIDLVASGEVRGVVFSTPRDKGIYLIKNKDRSSNGVNEETFLHETIHAYVKARWSSIGVYTERNRAALEERGLYNKEVGAEVEKFNGMWRKFSDIVMKEYDSGAEVSTTVISAAESPNEALAYILTNKGVQDYTKRIVKDGDGYRLMSEKEAGKRSWWDDFVDMIRKIFGLGPARDQFFVDFLEAGDRILVAGEKAEADFRVAAINEESVSPQKVENNRQAMQALLSGTPKQMRNAVAKAQKPTDKIIKEGADLQKKNRGCD